jgi:DNA (cytosine-5)-methyltransferase 1
MQVYDSKYWINEMRKSVVPKIRKSSPELRIADMFSGCGGLSLGALMACLKTERQLKIGLAADLWSDAIEVYKENFGSSLLHSEVVDLAKTVTYPGSLDLSEKGQQLCSKMGDVDVIMAGPPCQGHSDLNNSSRRDDPRNLLYTIPVAFALQSNAKILLVENVPTVVHSSDGVVNAALNALKARGFSVVEVYADAQNFGLPQTRKRHLIVASRVHTSNELDSLFATVEKRVQDIPLWPFINDLETEPEDGRLITRRSKISEDNKERIKYLFEESTHDLPDRLRPPCHRDKSHSYVSMYGRLHADRPAQTITSGFGSMGQGRFVHPTQPRLITAHEASRIQGFPDYFKFDAVKKVTALREMIGNAVPPAIAAVLLSLLIPGIG